MTGWDKIKGHANIKKYLTEALEHQDVFHACLISGAEEGMEVFDPVKDKFDALVATYKEDTGTVQEKLHFLFTFVDDTFGSGNEMLLLMTECTVQADCAKFIGMYGCEDYQKHNEEMMLTERGAGLLEKIEALEL